MELNAILLLLLLILFLFVVAQGAQLKRHIDATLGSGNLREAVRLPTGEDLNEWLAVNSKISDPYLSVRRISLYGVLHIYHAKLFICIYNPVKFCSRAAFLFFLCIYKGVNMEEIKSSFM